MPVYETSEDRKREAGVANVLCSSWKCDAIMLPKKSVADAILMKDEDVKAFVEIKCRSKEYDTYMISQRKINDLKSASTMFQVKSLVVVSYPNRICYFDASIEPDRVEQGGRIDRNDNHDVEQMNHYVTSRLKTIYRKASPEAEAWLAEYNQS